MTTREHPITQPTAQDATLQSVWANPPENQEAERALLGALMMQNRAFEGVSEFLEPEHFGDAVNGAVFAAIKSLITSGRQANAVTLKTYLNSDELVQKAGGIKYLTALSGSVVNLINSADYGRLVYDLAIRRNLIADGVELATRACDPKLDMDGPALAEEFQNRLADASIGIQGQKQLPTFQQAARDTLDDWERRARTGDHGLSYGLPSVDAQMGTMEGGDLIVIGARPSAGKTSFARVVAYHIARQCLARAQGKPAQTVLFFSAEMSLRKLIGAYLTGLSGIRPPSFRREFTESDYATLARQANALEGVPLFVDDTPAITVTQIMNRARQFSRSKGGLAAIVVDYLQLMGIERGLRFNDENARITHLCGGLKTSARKLGVPLMALSQLSRANELRDDKRPRLSDLRGSGTIEQDADAIGFIHREEYYLEREHPKPRANETDEHFSKRLAKHQAELDKHAGKMEVIAAKVRIGAAGTAVLDWDGPRMWVEDPETARLEEAARQHAMKLE